MTNLSLPYPAAHTGRTRRSFSSCDHQRSRRTPVQRPLKYEFDSSKLGNAHSRPGDQEALTSPQTRAEVRKHFESLVNAVSRTNPIGENVELNRPPVNSIGAATGGVLFIPPLIYREYADQLKKLARTATNELQRAFYLKMATTWQHAAIRYEAGSFAEFVRLSGTSIADEMPEKHRR